MVMGIPRPERVRQHGLETAVRPSSGHRRLSHKQARIVLAKAAALKMFEKHMRDPARGTSHDTLRSLAQEMGIEGKYIDQALTLYHPSAEEELAELKALGSSPTELVAAGVYRETLMAAYEEHFPGSRIEGRCFSDYEGHNLEVVFVVPRDKRIAQVEFSHPSHLAIILEDPRARQGFGDALDMLNTRFGEHIRNIRVSHTYEIVT
jgi:hypothetical protein